MEVDDSASLEWNLGRYMELELATPNTSRYIFTLI